MSRPYRTIAVVLAILTLLECPLLGLSIREFRKFSPDQQAMYITGAVSMVAYTYASNDEITKARCIQDWYFSKKGVDTPGPRAIAVEIAAAENVDAEKYHIEGVILGLTDKVCGVMTPKFKPRP